MIIPFKTLPLIGVLLLITSICEAQNLTRVKTAAASKKTLQLKTTQPARLAPDEVLEVVSKLSGYVEKVHVDIGDSVQKDQILVTLKHPELKDEFLQKQANIKVAEAAIIKAKALHTASEASLEAAKAKILQTEAHVLKAESDYKRWKSEFSRVDELVKRGAISTQIADETSQKLASSHANLEESKAMVKSSQADAAIAHASVASALADIQVATAERELAFAQLKLAQTMLDYIEIRAPFAGIVSSRGIDTGSYVHDKTSTLLKIIKVDKLRLIIDVPEMEAPWVDAANTPNKLADTINFTIKATNMTYAGKIARSSWIIHEDSRSMRTEIDVDNQKNELRPGIFATATIILEERKDVLTVTTSAVFKVADKTYCSVVQGNQIARKQVVTGLRVEPEIEILSGLAPADKVVTIRPDALIEGQQVELLP